MKPLIELVNLEKFFRQNDSSEKQYILRNLNFVLRKGERLTITGPSGSGKTTLLNIIGTLDKQNSGIYKFNGEDISSHNEKQLATIRNKQIGFLFQMHHLLPQLNVLDNILLPILPTSNKNEKKRALDRANHFLSVTKLENKTAAYPSQLSGGECQRIALIRALINEPELVLADEPTGALDATNAANLASLFFELNKELNTSFIVVTHSQELASTIGNVHRLVDGKLQLV